VGTVARVLRDQNRVVVEGYNLVRRFAPLRRGGCSSRSAGEEAREAHAGAGGWNRDDRGATAHFQRGRRGPSERVPTLKGLPPCSFLSDPRLQGGGAHRVSFHCRGREGAPFGRAESSSPCFLLLCKLQPALSRAAALLQKVQQRCATKAGLQKLFRVRKGCCSQSAHPVLQVRVTRGRAASGTIVPRPALLLERKWPRPTDDGPRDTPATARERNTAA
jgi:hypothetical protein